MATRYLCSRVFQFALTVLVNYFALHVLPMSQCYGTCIMQPQVINILEPVNIKLSYS